MRIAWDDLRTVLMLMRHQSLTAAGDGQDINYTTVARRIKRAEDSLKNRFLNV
ncbi:MAG: LysR family transcriptional regulator [Litoreibacter sp.]